MQDKMWLNQFEKWETVIKDKNQLERIKEMEILIKRVETKELNVAELELILVRNVEPLMKQFNKYENENIKLFKSVLNNYRSIVLDYEKETTQKIKQLKKLINDNIKEGINPTIIIKNVEMIPQENHVCKCGVCGKEIK